MKKIAKKKMGGTTKKYEDGGKVTRADIRNAQREAKLKRIEAGTEPSTYEKVANISGNVAKTAVAAGETAKAIRDARSGTAGGPGMKKGGMVKKYQDGGKTGAQLKSEGMKLKGEGMKLKGEGMKLKGQAMKTKGKALKKEGAYLKAAAKEPVRASFDKAFGIKTAGTDVTPGFKNGGAIKKMKTGGMANSNAKISTQKTAQGKVGGISKAPKTAVPKAKYGMSMRKK